MKGNNYVISYFYRKTSNGVLDRLNYNDAVFASSNAHTVLSISSKTSTYESTMVCMR